MKVSIITIVLNNIDTVKDSILSVDSQDYNDTGSVISIFAQFAAPVIKNMR